MADTKKHLENILRHKQAIFEEANRIGDESLIINCLLHDNTKFDKECFFPYADQFQGHGANDYSAAMLHHFHSSPHHWQYWVTFNDFGGLVPVEMPNVYVLEMLCDWQVTGRALGEGDNGAKNWFTKNGDKMIMHELTRERVVNNLRKHFGDKS